MSTHRPKLVLLGTAGGPLPSPTRAGIAQAVVIGGRAYLVDCGYGATRQLRRARLLSGLHKVFLTHLHSDHTCDYFNVFLLGWPILQWQPPVHVFGPGPAGALPPDELPIVHPGNPTPGLLDMTRAQFEAHAYDINIRMREAGRHDLRDLVVPHEIGVPADARTPFLVDEDDDARVTAVLVDHAPVHPAFAFRFDTAAGSIVFSGDTAPCPSLVTLAASADILVHEVFDDRAVAGEAADDSPEGQRQHHHLVTSHTPLSEVGRVAAQAGVGRLVLTHFVPGDDTVPDEHWVKGAAAAFDGEVVVGHDLLELTL